MRLRRRTAVWLAVAAVVLSLGGAAWRMTRPEYLRRQLLALGREALNEGWNLQVDSVDYALLDGRATIRGLRLERSGEAEPVVSIPTVEAKIRFAALLGRGRLATEIRISDPRILVERGADGTIPLAGAFRSGGGRGPSGRPRITVEGGTVRLKAPGLLADGEEIVLAVESLALEESRSGGPAGIAGVLVEKGSAAGGKGALGRVAVSGEFPWRKRGLAATAERFTVDDDLLGRLDPSVREKLAPFRITGPFGDGSHPALEVLVTRPSAKAEVDVQVTARPRGLDVHLRDFDYPLSGVAGEVSWNSGERVVRVRDIELLHGPSSFQAKGSLDLSSPEAPFEIRFGATNLLLDEALRKALPESVRKVWDTYDLRGVVDIGSGAEGGSRSFQSFVRRTGTGARVEVDVTAQLVDAGVSYRGLIGKDGERHGFVWPVDGITGEVSVKAPVDADGAASILLRARGKHGDTEVRVEGSVTEWPEKRSKVDLTIEAKDVPLDASVRDCSPIIQDLFRRFRPEGRLSNLQVHVAQDAHADAPTLATVVAEFDGHGGMTWERMPMAVGGLHGTVAYRERLLAGRKAVIVEITGVRGTTPEGAAVFADGTVEGEGDAELRLRVRAEALLLDGLLEQAVRDGKVEDAVRLWDNLRPSGPVDLVVDVSGPASKPRQSIAVTLRGAYLEGWGEVRFPVADLTGTVDVGTDSLVLHSVRGIHGGREVSLSGEVRDLGGKGLLDLTLKAPGFPLDESARGILGPSLSQRLGAYFTTVRPAAGLAGDVTVRLRGPGSAIDPVVAVENLRGGAAPFDLRGLAFAGGKVRYEDGALAIEDVVGTMGDRGLRIASGSLRLDRGEGALSVEVRRLRFPADLIGLIPADTAAGIEEAVPDRFIHFDGLKVSLSEGWRRIELDGAVSLSPQKAGSTGGLGLEGTFRLDRFTLLRGEDEGAPTAVSGGVDITRGALDAGVEVRDLAGRLEVGGSLGNLGQGLRGTLTGATGRVQGRALRDAGGELLLLPGGVFLAKSLLGNLAGGEVGVSVEVGGRHHFEGIVTLRNARAREFFAPADPDSKVEGQIEATLRFRKPRSSQPVLLGDGRVDIKNGRLFQVPVFTAIFNLLRIGDPPEFTSGRLVFAISGDKLTFSEVNLDSSVLGIHQARGRSAAYMDGRLDLKLLPEFKTGGILGLTFDVIGLVTKPIFERIYTIYVRGTVQRPEVSFQIIPGLFAGDLKDGPVFAPPPPAFSVERRAPWDF